MSEIVSSSAIARNDICHLKSLRRLYGTLADDDESDEGIVLKSELVQSLMNIEDIW